MKSIVLCEKPSQARNVQAAVGNRFGRVIGLRGHIIRLADPEEVNPEWKKWSCDLLRPESTIEQVHAICLTGGSAFISQPLAIVVIGGLLSGSLAMLAEASTCAARTSRCSAT